MDHGDDLRRAEPGAAPRRRGRARSRLHPRGRGVRQDDDDHAADRAPGRDGHLPRGGDPRGHLHGQGGGGDARAPRAARRRRACARGRSTRPRSASSTCTARRPGRSSPRRRSSSSNDRARLPSPYRFRPVGDLATEIEWAKNRRLDAGDYADARRRAPSAAPARPDDARLPGVRAPQGRAREGSTSRTSSSSRSSCSRRTPHALRRPPRPLRARSPWTSSRT